MLWVVDDIDCVLEITSRIGIECRCEWASQAVDRELSPFEHVDDRPVVQSSWWQQVKSRTGADRGDVVGTRSYEVRTTTILLPRPNPQMSHGATVEPRRAGMGRMSGCRSYECQRRCGAEGDEGGWTDERDEWMIRSTND